METLPAGADSPAPVSLSWSAGSLHQTPACLIFSPGPPGLRQGLPAPSGVCPRYSLGTLTLSWAQLQKPMPYVQPHPQATVILLVPCTELLGMHTLVPARQGRRGTGSRSQVLTGTSPLLHSNRKATALTPGMGNPSTGDSVHGECSRPVHSTRGAS